MRQKLLRRILMIKKMIMIENTNVIEKKNEKTIERESVNVI